MDTISEAALKEYFGSKCEVCGSDNFRKIISDGRDYEYEIEGVFEIWVCKECGYAFQRPRYIKPELERLYPLDYANYDDFNSGIMNVLARMYYSAQARDIAGYIGKSGKVLDVGCSNGHFLELLKEYGDFELHGVEIKPEIAQRARKKGFEVFTGQIEDGQYANGGFDLIRANHLIEHATFPSMTLYYCNKLLKQGGYLYGETPNIDCFDFKILGKYWGCLHLPRHISFFTPDTFSRMAARAGFEIVSLTPSPMTPGWSLGFQNYLVDRLKLSLRQGRTRIYPLLVLLSIPLVKLQQMAGKACVMKFVLKKAGSREYFLGADDLRANQA